MSAYWEVLRAADTARLDGGRPSAGCEGCRGCEATRKGRAQPHQSVAGLWIWRHSFWVRHFMEPGRLHHHQQVGCLHMATPTVSLPRFVTVSESTREVYPAAHSELQQTLRNIKYVFHNIFVVYPISMRVLGITSPSFALWVVTFLLRGYFRAVTMPCLRRGAPFI